jgi:hypothetical protein
MTTTKFDCHTSLLKPGSYTGYINIAPLGCRFGEKNNRINLRCVVLVQESINSRTTKKSDFLAQSIR